MRSFEWGEGEVVHRRATPDEQAFEIVPVRLCRSNKHPQNLRLHESSKSAEALLDSQDLAPCVFSS